MRKTTLIVMVVIALVAFMSVTAFAAAEKAAPAKTKKADVKAEAKTTKVTIILSLQKKSSPESW